MPSTDPSNTKGVELPAPRRGDVIRVRVDPVEGSEKGGERPVLVVSPDIINKGSPIFLAATITSKKTTRAYSFEVVVDAGEGGLPLRSKILLMQMRTLDRVRIVSRYGSVSDETMTRVEEALKIATGLTSVDQEA